MSESIKNFYQHYLKYCNPETGILGLSLFECEQVEFQGYGFRLSFEEPAVDEDSIVYLHLNLNHHYFFPEYQEIYLEYAEGWKRPFHIGDILSTTTKTADGKVHARLKLPYPHDFPNQNQRLPEGLYNLLKKAFPGFEIEGDDEKAFFKIKEENDYRAFNFYRNPTHVHVIRSTDILCGEYDSTHEYQAEADFTEESLIEAVRGYFPWAQSLIEETIQYFRNLDSLRGEEQEAFLLAIKN